MIHDEDETEGRCAPRPSVRLTSDPLASLAGIDEILCRGDRTSFLALLQAIIAAPDGPVAERVRILYEGRRHQATDPEFYAWPQFQAAWWLVEALQDFR